MPRHGNPCPLQDGPLTTAGPSPRHPPLPPPPFWPPPRLAPSFPCPDTGIHAPCRTDRSPRLDPRHDTRRSPRPRFGLLPASRRRHSRAPTRESMPLADGPPTTAGPSPRHPPLPPPPSGLLPASRRHSRAPTRESMPLADGPPTTAGPSPRHPPLPPPPSGLLPRGGGLRWGATTRTRPTRRPPPRHHSRAPEPVEGGPSNPDCARAGPPSRFTSKCPKMKMSHYFAPPLVNLEICEWKTSRFGPISGHFGPFSVQFRLTRRHSRAPRESTPPRAASWPPSFSCPAPPRRAERRRGFYAEPRSRAELPAAVGTRACRAVRRGLTPVLSSGAGFCCRRSPSGWRRADVGQPGGLY